ncbi:SMP-30/gluconolactonase/LRE family protein [Zavarzinia compransoris]|uniref:SMP-30/gluconolactonase/LRE family protein n=1 Tax=Zavarzinia marina TaxID=2911065 RepID=UPI001F31F63D|nr:SMP-30/gluconolactonase/LRE family protein [Zavarzinia marina]MCF4166905.1 SMP-30/gluconolactonase/LRE family protein [Zavarzinia marina]
MSNRLRPFLLASLLMAALSPGAAAIEREAAPAEILNIDAHYPEGPQLLADGSLLSAEMPRDRVVRSGPGGSDVVWQEKGCGPTSVKRLPDGGFWVLCHLGGRVVRLSPDFQTLAHVDWAEDGSRITWPNDASVDEKGNLFLSSSGLFSRAAPATGRLIRIDAATNAAKVLAGGIHYSNGVLVQEDRHRVLVSAHLDGRVLSFPLLAPDRVGPPSVFFDLATIPPVEHPYDLGGPDGLAAFADGDVVIANYGNGRLIVVSATGEFHMVIPVALPYVTNMAITPDQKSLYVTMTRDNRSHDLDGRVQRYAIRQKDKD